MAVTFGIQKVEAFGTYGEFSIGGQLNIQAQYVLTKMQPGNDGSWENVLASQMVPWREVFSIEELAFDELLQRDLDDSRVAHELIPYLLGETGANAKFFPPILAVVVPRKRQGPGIEALYPKPSSVHTPGRWIESFGDLFDCERLYWENQLTPLAALRYNRSRSAFVIVDGQHRAMAVLALHRQLNNEWGNNPYAAYYNHIHTSSYQLQKIELPVCLVYFPELHEENVDLKSKGIDLRGVCREIFVVVNRTAKRVTQSRELLLDDDDIAAHLMRQTMSRFKNRGEDDTTVARIYSFAYGDASADLSKQVVTGQHEYATAVALHKLHCAMAFGRPEAFAWQNSVDVSDMRNARNPGRPSEILLGTEMEYLATISRQAGRSLERDRVESIVLLLGELGDIILLALFDELRPFSIHNAELRALRMRLSDVQARADLVQNKCYSLLFEGSGVRNVFEEHLERLKASKEELTQQGRNVSDHIIRQIEYAQSVLKALDKHLIDFRRKRACTFFHIDHDALYGTEDLLEDQRRLESKDRQIYQTLSTQAFQLGFVMAVLTAVENMLENDATYHHRKDFVQFVTDLYVNALNRFLSPDDDVRHRTMRGFVALPCSDVFDASSLGLRGLFVMSTPELNERCWDFFRYAIVELVHSQRGGEVVRRLLLGAREDSPAGRYLKALPAILQGLHHNRVTYINDAIDKALNSRDFETKLQMAEAEAKGRGQSEEAIQALREKLIEDRRQEVWQTTQRHLEASLDTLEDGEAMLQRLILEHEAC